ncbi:MAG: hypothetical protein ACRC2B_18420, partial [Rubrivivax sp.]
WRFTGWRRRERGVELGQGVGRRPHSWQTNPAVSSNRDNQVPHDAGKNMSMKKTDLEKQMAKKLDGQMRAGPASHRFGQGSVAAKDKTGQKPGPRTTKLVPVSCRLPTELVAQLRERAVGFEGGLSALMTQAVQHWLAAAGAAK